MKYSLILSGNDVIGVRRSTTVRQPMQHQEPVAKKVQQAPDTVVLIEIIR